MHRTLLFLLLVALCYGQHIYELSVDPKNGQDASNCVTAPIVQNTISPNASCKSIAYALKGGITNSDTLTLTLYPGVYSGANNTNQVFSFLQYDILGSDTTGANAIIDCGFSQTGFQINPSASKTFYTITNIAFHNCLGGTGGAVSIGNGAGTVKITNSAFVSNRATTSGGAIYSKSFELFVSSCIFSNNSAGNGLGGAIYVEDQDVTVTGSTFYLNTASSGAAIYGLDIGTADSPLLFTNNNFTNNTASVKGGAFFADSTKSGNRTYDFTRSTFDNNCATSPYTDSFDVQVRCAGSCTISNRGNFSGCTDIETNIPPATNDPKKHSNKDTAVIIGVVVPFSILAILSVVLFLYIRKRHNAEMAKRDDYRKKILRALENLPPEEQEAARLEAQNADPKAPKCQLCQTRPINSPLPCGHAIVCSVCRTILLECPVKGCKQATR